MGEIAIWVDGYLFGALRHSQGLSEHSVHQKCLSLVRRAREVGRTGGTEPVLYAQSPTAGI